MNDSAKEKILTRCALGYLCCWLITLSAAIVFGKSYGRMLALTLIPLYSIFYFIFYRKLSLSFEDTEKRILAFGITARGTLTGALYHLSAVIAGMTCYVFLYMGYQIITQIQWHG